MFQSENSFLESDDITQYLESPRKQKRKKEKNNLHLELKEIEPLTVTQELIFTEFFDTKQNLFMHGYAGTGKSYIACYLMLKELMAEKYKQLIIVRSTVPSRDQGFLPGNAKEKAKIYEKPYYEIFSDLFGRGDAYELLKRKKIVEFESTSYLRGTTFNDSLIIFDEMQNATWSEASTVFTRIGKNSRLIVSGDFHQTDLRFNDEKRGVLKAMGVLKLMNCVSFFEFKKEDIVRSGFVKDFILAEDRYKYLNT